MRFNSRTVGISSGKGGVGKTFSSINLARSLGKQGKKVLLIDCDFNLGNCGFALGLKSYKTILDHVKGEKIEACITELPLFDFLGSESGDLEILNGKYNLTENVLKVIFKLQKSYEYIFLDFGAGLDEKFLSILAYCDERVLVVNPDILSIKDTYALVKVMKEKFGVVDFNLLANKVKNLSEFNKVKKVLESVTGKFLNVDLRFLEYVSWVSETSSGLEGGKRRVNICLEQDFNKVIKCFIDDNTAEALPFWKVGKKQDAFFHRLRSN